MLLYDVCCVQDFMTELLSGWYILYFFSPAKFSTIERATDADLVSLHMQSIKSATNLQIKARNIIDSINDLIKHV